MKYPLKSRVQKRRLVLEFNNNLFCRDVAIATVISFVASAGWYFAVNKPRRDNYAAFYKNYDAEADFQRMKEAGVFQSVQVNTSTRSIKYYDNEADFQRMKEAGTSSLYR